MATISLLSTTTSTFHNPKTHPNPNRSHCSRISFSSSRPLQLTGVCHARLRRVVALSMDDGQGQQGTFSKLNHPNWAKRLFGALAGLSDAASRRVQKLGDAVEKVDSVVEKVEEYADKVEEIAGDIAEELPEGKLKDLVEKVEDASETISEKADTIDNVLDKVTDLLDDIEEMKEISQPEKEKRNEA